MCQPSDPLRFIEWYLKCGRHVDVPKIILVAPPHLQTSECKVIVLKRFHRRSCRDIAVVLDRLGENLGRIPNCYVVKNLSVMKIPFRKIDRTRDQRILSFLAKSRETYSVAIRFARKLRHNKSCTSYPIHYVYSEYVCEKQNE